MATRSGRRSTRDHRGSRATSTPAVSLGLRELGVLAFAASIYFGVRVLIEGSAAEAIRNAERILNIERALGVDLETSVQQIALDSDSVRLVGNLSYVWLHWPLLLTVLWILFHSDRLHYHQLRNAMFASGTIGLFLFAILPTTPPRFMEGFVGTVSDDARRHYLSYPLSWTNKFAAFPSFHVGWTLIACVALAASLNRDNQRWLAMVPAALVAIAVVSTGNHYLLDALAGAAIAVAAYVYFGSRDRSVGHAVSTSNEAPSRARSEIVT